MKFKRLTMGMHVGEWVRVLAVGLVAAILFLAGTTLTAVRGDSQRAEKSVRALSRASDANQAARQSLTDAQIQQRRYRGTKEPAASTAYKTLVGAYHDNIVLLGALLNAEPSVSTSRPQWSAALREERQAGAAWLDYARLELDRPAGNKAVDLFAPRQQTLFQSFQTANAGIDTWIRTRLNAQRIDTEAAAERHLALVALLARLSIVFALLIAFSKFRSLTRPLNQLRQTVSRQRSGDISARANERKGGKKVRLLAADFNSLTDENQVLSEEQAHELELHELERKIDLLMRHGGDTDELLEALSGILGEGLAADRVIVHVLGGSTPFANRGQWARDGLPPAPWASEERIPVLRKLLDELWINDRQIAYTDFLDEQPHSAAASRWCFDECGMRAILLVPIGIAEEAWGLIVVGACDNSRDWTAAETNTVSRSAMSAARLISAVEHEANQVEHISRLENLDRQKTDFLSTVSHELRTPLTSISGYLELLEEGAVGELSAGQQKMVHVIGRNAQRLQGLIEDLLVLNRIESGGLHVTSARVDFARLVEFAVEELRPIADRAGIVFHVSLPDDCATVTGDAAHLQRAVVNILSNAIKFSPDGGSIDLALAVDDRSAVLICEDHGIGIPESDRSQMFSRFFRASNAHEQAIPGTGLGLTIVRQIVEDHHGALDLSSQEGVGTLVTIRLPLSPDLPRRAGDPTTTTVAT